MSFRAGAGAAGRGIAWLLIVCILGAPAIAASEEVPRITALRYGQHDDRVRLIFDVLPAPVYTIFTLRNPDRLVIDFPALEWAVEPLTEPVPIIADIRFGLFRRDRARLVLELTEPVEVDRTFTQDAAGTEPGRLLIDLSPVTRDVFDARAGAPERARWTGVAPILQTPDSEEDVIVAIDPGHGGIDPGAVSGEMLEKEIVLDFSRRLADVLDSIGGYRAYLVRNDDSFVPLAERVARARRARAHVFISVHADTVASGTASGASAYTLSDDGSDEAANALAERENRADVIAGADLGGESDDLTRLLVELAQRGTQIESIKLASAVVAEMSKSMEVLKSRPLRRASFRVLKAPDIPSILLELGFLNSERDRARLADPAWVGQAARAIAGGIETWRETASPGFLTPR